MGRDTRDYVVDLGPTHSSGCGYGKPCSCRTPKHTPLPWKVSQTGKFVMHSRPGTVLNVCEASREDAAFIANCVNSHEELIDLLKTMDKAGVFKGEWANIVDKVIAKASAQ